MKEGQLGGLSLKYVTSVICDKETQAERNKCDEIEIRGRKQDQKQEARRDKKN